MYEWIGGAIAHDELIAAFDRLDSLDVWIDSWDGSRRDQARLKNLTSQLIGRFAHAATDATRSAFPLASLIRFDADVVVPREIQAEIAVLKGIVAAFVMSRNTRQPIYAQQRAGAHVARRRAARHRAKQHLDPASPQTGAPRPTTPPASASSSTRSRASPTSRRWPGTSASCSGDAGCAASRRRPTAPPSELG